MIHVHDARAKVSEMGACHAAIGFRFNTRVSDFHTQHTEPTSSFRFFLLPPSFAHSETRPSFACGAAPSVGHAKQGRARRCRPPPRAP